MNKRVFVFSLESLRDFSAGEGRELVALHPTVALVSASLASPMHPMNVKIFQSLLI